MKTCADCLHSWDASNWGKGEYKGCSLGLIPIVFDLTRIKACPKLKEK